MTVLADSDKRDPVGDLAHMITGCIAANCCHKTGGYNTDPTCECRDIAEMLIEEKLHVMKLLKDA